MMPGPKRNSKARRKPRRYRAITVWGRKPHAGLPAASAVLNCLRYIRRQNSILRSFGTRRHFHELGIELAKDSHEIALRGRRPNFVHKAFAGFDSAPLARTEFFRKISQNFSPAGVTW